MAASDLESTVNLRHIGLNSMRNNLSLTGEIYTVKVPGRTVEARPTSIALELAQLTQEDLFIVSLEKLLRMFGTVTASTT